MPANLRGRLALLQPCLRKVRPGPGGPPRGLSEGDSERMEQSVEEE